jgi:hypothetical protein
VSRVPAQIAAQTSAAYRRGTAWSVSSATSRSQLCLVVGWLTRAARPIHVQNVRTVLLSIALALVFASTSAAAERPRYDVPAGYAKCPTVRAWNGFFKWVSVRHATCRDARRFLRAYAARAEIGPMPRCVRGFACTIRYWRNEDGDPYASRHRCTRHGAVIRFYGMV